MSFISKLPPILRQPPVLGTIFAGAAMALAIPLTQPSAVDASPGLTAQDSARAALVVAPSPAPGPNPAVIGITQERYQTYIAGTSSPKAVDPETNTAITDDTIIATPRSFEAVGDRLQDLGVLTPTERETPRRDYLTNWLSANRPANACAPDARLSEETRFRSVVATLENLQDGGLTRAELRFQKDCFNSIGRPSEMVAYDDERLHRLLGANMANAVSLRFASWQGEPSALEPQLQPRAYRQRYDDLSYLINGIRAEYGMDPIRVIFMPLQETSLIRGLQFSNFDGAPAIVINSGPQMGVMRDPLQAIATAAEEAFHSVDSELGEMMAQGRLRPGDPRFRHAVYTRLNFVDGGYAPIQRDPVTGLDTTQSYYDYSHQYGERTAKEKAEAVRVFAARFLMPAAPPSAAPNAPQQLVG